MAVSHCLSTVSKCEYGTQSCVLEQLLSDFKTSAENEGVSTTDMEACSHLLLLLNWYSLPSLDQKCLVELLLSTLEKENWTLSYTQRICTGETGVLDK